MSYLTALLLDLTVAHKTCPGSLRWYNLKDSFADDDLALRRMSEP
jgi:hypothetical protein